MLGRLRKSLRFILYLLVSVLFALLLFWSRGILWPAAYRELRADSFWVLMAVILVTIAVIYYQEWQKDDKNNEDDP